MSRVPVVREVAWVSLIPQLFIFAGLSAAVYLILPYPTTDIAVMMGAVLFILWSFLARAVLTRAHRSGVRLMKKGRFREATPKFQAALAFFERYPWVDKFRYVVIFSNNRLSYREMALCNIAFAHAQLGEGPQAKVIYERVLAEYPDNGIARSSLNMLRAGERGR